MPANVLSDLPALAAQIGAMSRSAAAGTKKRAQLKKATQQFEAVFIGTMLKEVHKSLENSQPLFGSSYEAKFYQELTDEQIAGRMSQTGAFGLGKTLYQSLEKTLAPIPAAFATDKTAAQSAAARAPGKAVTAPDKAALTADTATIAPEARKK